MPIAEIFISAFVTVLFEKLASGDLLAFVHREGVHKEITNWSKMLGIIKSKLSDAEDQQIKNQAVQIWLEELQDLAYDLDDVLDEFATEQIKLKLDGLIPLQPNTIKTKVNALLPGCCTSYTSCFGPSGFMFNSNMMSKINEISTRLESVTRQIRDLNLDSFSSTPPNKPTSQRTPTTSLIHEPMICGRDNDRNEIIKLLLEDVESSHGNDNICVIPIVGMSGIGKTTLAQAVYNDDIVKEHFKLRVWVCVSEEFDLIRITKAILESVTSRSCDFNNLDQIQVELKKSLAGRQFLIILDDVWHKVDHDWRVLKSPFCDAIRGSKVIITTRDKDVATLMGSSKHQHYFLQLLPFKDCWSVFAQLAFENRNMNEYTNLVEIGKKIVDRCKGLPLSARALGGLLRCKESEAEWKDVLDSEVWWAKDSQILPSLWLSYHHLPSYLKPCFAYCSILPKDYKFGKDELVLLWMAEGFIQQGRENKQLEDIGRDYFHELLSRSLFQLSSTEDNSNSFVMHDLVNDLAQEISGHLCFRLEEKLEDLEKSRNLGRARHSSILQGNYDGMKKFESFFEGKRLRTFLPFSLKDIKCYLASSVPSILFPKMRYLRCLSLRFYNVIQLPDSVGNMKHLRYLDLSFTEIETLPDWVQNLYNLQTLILRECKSLKRLPKKMGNLINLRYFDVTNAGSLKEMPLGIGNMESLQMLSNFIVTKNNGSRVRELGKLRHIGETLSISGLHNVTDPMDAKGACIIEKERLKKLIMLYGANSDDIPNEGLERDVLDMLKPHITLTELHIGGYQALNPDVFSIELHHEGRFRWGTDISYEGGKVNYIDNCKPIEMSYLDIIAMAYAVGCTDVKRLFFKKCGPTFPNEMPEIMYDHDALGLTKFLTSYRLVEVYCDSVGEIYGDENAISSSDEDGDYIVQEEPELETFSGSDEEIGLADDDLEAELNELLVDLKTKSKGKEKAKGKGKGKGKEKGKVVLDVDDIELLNEGYASSDALYSDCDSDEEKEMDESIVFQPVDLKAVNFKLGMKFRTADEFKHAVKVYAVQNSKNIKYSRNAKSRMNLYCMRDNGAFCDWSMYVSLISGEQTMQIKTFVDKHTCNRATKNSSTKPRFIAMQYLEQIRRNPRWEVKAFRDQVAADLECEVTYSTAFRAFTYAKRLINGSSGEQYKLLWDYLTELKRSNPGTTAVMKVENGECRFRRLYIFWGALKRGFIEGCKPLVGVDGCHLTGPHRGVLLTVVAIDPNNCMYPFAYAIVDQENKHTWKWFLKLLRSDMNMQRSADYTFISDKQKGLIIAMEKVFPGVEHRFCVRHLYNNFKQVHKGLALKEMLWKAARASTKSHWEEVMRQLQVLDSADFGWLAEKPGEQWSRSHFGTHSKCDMLLNNLCKSFNACIKVARGQTILTMLETIRLYLMDLVMRKREIMLKKKDLIICPKINTKLEQIRKDSHIWTPKWNGGRQFEVHGPESLGSQFSVDLDKNECGCRRWKLSGIPCVHVVSIHWNRIEPLSYVNGCYSRENYMRTYSNLLMPMNGKDMWKKTNQPIMLPPLVTVKLGKPAKARRRDPGEPKSKAQKLSKKGVKMKCKKCGKEGHNIRSCGKEKPVRVRKSKAREETTDLIDEDSSEGESEQEENLNENAGVEPNMRVEQEEVRVEQEEVTLEASMRVDESVRAAESVRADESVRVDTNVIEQESVNVEEDSYWDNVVTQDHLWNMVSIDSGCKTQESGSNTQDIGCNTQGSAKKLTPRRSSAKKHIAKRIRPVRKSIRIMNQPKLVPTVSHIDLSNEDDEVVPTQESVNLTRHGGIFNEVKQPTVPNEAPRSSTVHGGIITNTEQLQLPKGHFWKNGTRFPTWLGDPMFTNMVHIEIKYCRNCSVLPALGQLQTLKKLYIEGMNNVKHVNREFYGKVCPKPFPHLETLSFKDMPEWEDWLGFGVEDEVQPFANVKELLIEKCPKLLGKLPTNLPSLQVLEIINCQKLVVEVDDLNYPLITSLFLDAVEIPFTPSMLSNINKTRESSSLSSVIIKNVSMPDSLSNMSISFQHLNSVKIVSVPKLEYLPNWLTRDLTALKQLNVHHCTELKTLINNSNSNVTQLNHHFPVLQRLHISYCPELVTLLFEETEEESERQRESEVTVQSCMKRLKSLRICGCGKLEKLPWGLYLLTCLVHIKIDRCDNLVSLPDTGFPPSLRILRIYDCKALESALPCWNSDHNLESLHVSKCPSLTGLVSASNNSSSMNIGGLPSSLKCLHIRFCEKLEALVTGGEDMKIHCPSLETITINSCGRLKYLPDTRCDDSLGKLKELSLKGCGELRNLPDGWFCIISSLSCIAIGGWRKGAEKKVFSYILKVAGFLNNLTCLDLGRNITTAKYPSEWGLHRLSSLRKLRILGQIRVAREEEEEEGKVVKVCVFPLDGMLLPTSLTYLEISNFPDLERLSSTGFESLTFLEILRLEFCPRLAYFPEGGLPDTLWQLRIVDCPLLKNKCENGKGKYLPIISRVPYVIIL